ncbi:MAG: NPCBM/NEW2 domain-containing protein [Paenibacillaceae bacterium]
MFKVLKRSKGFIMGFMCCAILTATVAYAQDSIQIEVYFNDLKYMIDGVQKKPVVNQGFIHSGTTYVPLRFISEALDKEVSWDGETNTIWVGKKLGRSITLSAIDYARVDGAAHNDYLTFDKWNGKDDAKHRFGSELTIAGSTYSRGLGIYLGEFSDGWGSVDYNLKGNYKQIYGYLGVDDYYRNSDAVGTIRIYGDGKEIYTSPKLKGGDEPLRIDVNLTGVLKLRIKFESDKKDDLDLLFTEVHLVQ